MDPFDPKVNYLEGFLPTSNPQLTPALPMQPTYRLGYSTLPTPENSILGWSKYLSKLIVSKKYTILLVEIHPKQLSWPIELFAIEFQSLSKIAIFEAQNLANCH